ncbi:unnamed protein product [Gadus morhua 'NCC']
MRRPPGEPSLLFSQSSYIAFPNLFTVPFSGEGEPSDSLLGLVFAAAVRICISIRVTDLTDESGSISPAAVILGSFSTPRIPIDQPSPRPLPALLFVGPSLRSTSGVLRADRPSTRKDRPTGRPAGGLWVSLRSGGGGGA